VALDSRKFFVKSVSTVSHRMPVMAAIVTAALRALPGDPFGAWAR
jgi:hypothetical protein